MLPQLQPVLVYGTLLQLFLQRSTTLKGPFREISGQFPSNSQYLDRRGEAMKIVIDKEIQLIALNDRKEDTNVLLSQSLMPPKAQKQGVTAFAIFPHKPVIYGL